MRDCVNLTSINLSGLIQLTTIDPYFLYRCTSLTSIDLSGLTQLTTIGNDFMWACVKLTSIKCSQRVKNMIDPKLKHLKQDIKYIITP
jgi:hypothetical protein